MSGIEEVLSEKLTLRSGICCAQDDIDKSQMEEQATKSTAEKKLTEAGAQTRSLAMKWRSRAGSISKNDDVSDEDSARKRRKPRMSNSMSLDDDISGQIQELVHLKYEKESLSLDG
jgi:hypothetical protein